MNLFYHRCKSNTFKIQCSAHDKITEISNSKLRSSVYKLYRWLCFKTNRWPTPKTISAKLKEIKKATGLSKHAIINSRKKLERLSLIETTFQAGPGGKYSFSILNTKSGLPLTDWTQKPVPSYFPVPDASMLSEIFRDRWRGTDALVYDALALEMGKANKNQLALTGHWFDGVSKNTLYASEKMLAETGFIRVKDTAIEILHPETSQSMPAFGAEQEPIDRAYYYDGATGVRKRLHEEILTKRDFEKYYRKSVPRASEWSPGRDAHCPFHDDNTPSLSINCETGQFCCHACGVVGNKLVTFEMKLLGTDDIHTAWAEVARKIGFALCPRGRGKVTHRHVYFDEKSVAKYMVLRYEDETASYSRCIDEYGICTRPGLNGTKRILYNLPKVVAANVVVIVEGEKKADILSGLDWRDDTGKPVAVTGGADSWRVEHTEHLRGKRIVFLPDADEAGQRYQAAVESSLKRAEIEHEIVSFDEFGNDFRPFLENRTADEFVNFIGSPWLCASPPEIQVPF